MKKIRIIITGICCALLVSVFCVPSYALEDTNKDNSCCSGLGVSFKDKIKFFCKELSLDWEDYYEENYEEGYIQSDGFLELESKYLEKLGYPQSHYVEETDEYIKHIYYEYSFLLGKVIQTESLYAKEDIANIGKNGVYVVEPKYSINFKECCIKTSMTIKLNDDSYRDEAVETVKKSLEGTGLSIFVVDSYNIDNRCYVYKDGECLYIDDYNVDNNGLSYRMLGPNGEELTENQKDELLYECSGLGESGLLKDKKRYLDMIYLQYSKSSMDKLEAMKKYEEMLGNLKQLSLKELLDIFDEAVNRAMEDRRNQKGTNENVDLSGAGYFQKLVGNIPTLQGGTPTQICTRVINDCPVVDLFDDNFNRIAGAAVTNTEHTKFEYVYFVYIAEIDNGNIMLEVAGTDDDSVTGYNMEDYSDIETENGMMGYTSYYYDPYADTVP